MRRLLLPDATRAELVVSTIELVVLLVQQGPRRAAAQKGLNHFFLEQSNFDVEVREAEVSTVVRRSADLSLALPCSEQATRPLLFHLLVLGKSPPEV